MNCPVNVLRCNACGSNLVLIKAFCGVAEGEDGKLYDWEIQLQCEKTGCGRVYPLGCTKNEGDFIFPKQFLPNK